MNFASKSTWGNPLFTLNRFRADLPNSAVQPEDVLYILEVVLPNWELPHSLTLLRVPAYLGRSSVSTSRRKKLLKTPNEGLGLAMLNLGKSCVPSCLRSC